MVAVTKSTYLTENHLIRPFNRLSDLVHCRLQADFCQYERITPSTDELREFGTRFSRDLVGKAVSIDFSDFLRNHAFGRPP